MRILSTQRIQEDILPSPRKPHRCFPHAFCLAAVASFCLMANGAFAAAAASVDQGGDYARLMVTLGVSPSQLEMISYGKENPAVQGNNEAAWSKNRRDDFRVIAH